MTDYRAVMDLVLKGWSVRQITASMGCSHSTVQKVRKVLQAEQITTTAQIAGLNDEAVAVLFHDGRSTGQGVFAPIDFDSVVKARTGRHKTTLQVLWGEVHLNANAAGAAVLQLRAVSPACSAARRCHRGNRPDRARTSSHYAGGLGRNEDALVRPHRGTSKQAQCVCRLAAVFRDAVCLCV